MLGLAKRRNQAKTESKVTRLKFEKSGKNLVALFAFISIVFSGLGLLVQLIVLGTAIGIAKKPAPALVQLSDGGTMNVQAIGSTDRSPKVVQSFTTDLLTLLMSWNNEIPVKDGNKDVIKTDLGMQIATAAGEKRITTQVFQAGFAFSDNLRGEILKIVAEMTPPDVFQGSVKTALKFQQVTIPVQIEPGKWKVSVIGTLIQFQRGRADTVKVPFNKELVLQAVDTPALPQGGKFSNELENAIYNIRRVGLEITAMKDVESNITTPNAAAPAQQPTAASSATPNAAASAQQPTVNASTNPAN
jgi:hypothetical protein